MYKNVPDVPDVPVCFSVFAQNLIFCSKMTSWGGTTGTSGTFHLKFINNNVWRDLDGKDSKNKAQKKAYH